MSVVLFLVLLMVGLAIGLAALIAAIVSILNQWRHSSHADGDEPRKAGL